MSNGTRIMGVFREDYKEDSLSILVDSCNYPEPGSYESLYEHRQCYYDAIENCRPFTFIPNDYYKK